MYVEIKQLSVKEDWDKGLYSFTGELHVDGRLTAHISQESMGAATVVTPVDQAQQQKLDELSRWVALHPPLYYHPGPSGPGAKINRIDLDLPQYIAELVHVHQKIAEEPAHHRQMYADMDTKLVVGNPAEIVYRTFGFKDNRQPLFFLSLFPKSRERLEALVREEVLPSLSKTDYIINNNLTIEELMKLGIPREKIFPAPVYHFKTARKQKTQLPENKKQARRKK